MQTETICEEVKSIKLKKNSQTSVQVYGRKKTSIALALCRRGHGMIHVNGRPLDMIQPAMMRMKAKEPVLLLGEKYFDEVDIKINVKGGGQISQIYAVRQAIAKSLVAYYHKYKDEESKRIIKSVFMNQDRNLLVADYRKCEPKKFGGPGARSRYQKSYR